MSFRMRNKNYFNMVEVTLALGVAVIGVVCVMALIPVGLNASRDAIADNYLPDVAQEMMAAFKVTSLSTGKLTIPADIPDKNPAAMPNFDVDFERDPLSSDWVPFLGNSVTDSGGLVLRRPQTGLFLILQQTKVNGTYIADFSAVASVWYEQIKDFSFFNTSGNTLPTDVAQALMVEVSWPANIPYERRKDLGNIRTYRMDIFNPEVEIK